MARQLYDNPKQKEEARLTLPPFQTRAEPDLPETLDHLRGWVPPNHAYVLFEAHITHVYGQGDQEKGTRLMTLNVDNRPEQSEKITYYYNKGFKPIHFGNFPSADSDKAVRYGRGKGNPWVALERQVLRLMQIGNANKANEGLKARIAELEKIVAGGEGDALKTKVEQNRAALKKKDAVEEKVA